MLGPPLAGGGPPGGFWGSPPRGGPPGRGPPGPPGGGEPVIGVFPPQGGPGNHYHYYYNAGGPARNKNDHGAEVRKALAREGRLDIQKPEMFSGYNPWKWRTFLVQCLNTFQGKAHTYASDWARVVFASSYLQGIALDHYTALLHYNPCHPLFSDWQAVVQEFSEKFGIYNTVAEAENNLVNLKMAPDECFTTFLVQFEKEAYKTSWNYHALRYQLSKALPERIHNVLRIAPKQTIFEGLKHLVTQIDQHHWEDQAILPTARRPGEAPAAPCTSRWPRPLFPHNPPGKPPARLGNNSHTPGAPSGDRNPCPVACPNAQLQAAEIREQPKEYLDDDVKNLNDSANNPDEDEHLNANYAHNTGRPWIAVLEETKEYRRNKGLCLLCGKPGHFVQEYPERSAMGCAVWVMDGDEYEFQYAENKTAT
ncbi:hypothetical protein C0992_009412 [Termitomyces sp. T32_za158]|nr:hypothetical protein C0992_009412 [Termitomyces sp. T32_za158]